MAGTFELFVDAEAAFRFRLKAPDGTVMVVSRAFANKPAAVAGIAAVREYAGMGLITDLCPGAAKPQRSARHQAVAVGAVAPPARGRGKGMRQAVTPRRLTGVA